MAWQSVVLLAPIAAPAIGSILIGILRRSADRLRHFVAVSSALVSLGFATLIFGLWAAGTPLSHSYLGMLGNGLSFVSTGLGATLTLLSALLWLLAVLYAVVYMNHEYSKARFFGFLLASQAGCLGVFLAGDYFTLFLFFEIMTFAAYPLVIHNEDRPAMLAGNMYLYLSVAGGLVLLFGIIGLVWAADTAAITPVLSSFTARPALLYGLSAAFIVGFGVKAGLVPLHVWLPQAHPVAPSPASALLSGIMIKTGAYGIIRFTTVSLTYPAGAQASLSLTAATQNIGFALALAGLITMLAGAVMALMQKSMKRILAYSSVSQMGYIILPLGLAVYLAPEGGLAYVGSIFHILNHAVFKSGLFMMLGAVYLATHTLELDDLGGLRRIMPFTATVTLVASLAVLGMPGFSGFASKTIIHDALLEGAKHTQMFWIGMAEKLFILGSALTAAYFIKLYKGVFLGPYRGKAPSAPREHPLVKTVLAIYAGLILGVGLFPYYFMNLVASLSTAGVPSVQYHLTEHLAHIHFWDSHAYWGVMMPALLGVGVFAVSARLSFDQWSPPRWLSVENLVYLPLSRGFLYVCSRWVCGIEGGIADVYDHSSAISGSLIRRVKRIDTMIEGGYEQGNAVAEDLINQVRRVETYGAEAVESLSLEKGELVRKARTGMIDSASQDVPMPQDDPARGSELRHAEAEEPPSHQTFHQTAIDQSWCPQNITLGSLILAVVLMCVLFVLYFFGGAAL